MPEFDIQKQIKYWHDEAIKSLDFAERAIIRDQEVVYGLFFVHLALEKMLKAHVCKQTQNISPRIHRLVTLARLAQLELNESDLDFLAVINIYNLEGRYPEMAVPTPSFTTAKGYLDKVKEMVAWLAKQL